MFEPRAGPLPGPVEAAGGGRDALSNVGAGRLAGRRSRLRHVGHGRLDRIGRHPNRSPRSRSPSRGASTSSTRPRPTATATASSCSAGSWPPGATSASTRRPRFRPRTASGRAGEACRWPQVFPRDYVRRYVDISRANLAVETIDLLQLHVWEDDWLADGDLQRTVAELKTEGSIRAFGISLNRWEPWNGVKAVESGLVDAVQVIYNIFDQAPEDELFPACRENGVGGHRPGSLRRGQSYREPDPAVEVAVGRLAQHILRPGELGRIGGPRRCSEAARPARHDHGRDGAALHPLEPGRKHSHSGDAQDGERGGEYGRQRRRSAASRTRYRAAQAPLGPPADELEPVGGLRESRTAAGSTRYRRLIVRMPTLRQSSRERRP